MAQFELDVADLQSELREVLRRLDQLDDAQQVVVGEVLVSQVVSPQLVRRPVPVAPMVSHHCTAHEKAAIMKHDVPLNGISGASLW